MFVKSLKQNVELMDFTIIKLDKSKESNNEKYAFDFTTKYKIADSAGSAWYGDVYEIEFDKMNMVKTYSGTWWTDKKEFKTKRIEVGSEATFKNQKFVGYINQRIPVELILSSDKEAVQGNISYQSKTHEVKGEITPNGLRLFDISHTVEISPGNYGWQGNTIEATKRGDTFNGKTKDQDGNLSSIEFKKIR